MKRSAVTRRLALVRRQDSPINRMRPPSPGARLTLAEQLRAGAFADSLSIPEIAALEFPSDTAEQKRWRNLLSVAVIAGDLSAAGGLIARAVYQTWRNQEHVQKPAPVLSYIARWLAVPAPDPAQFKPAQGAAANRAALARLLDELDKRAAEKGAGLNRDSLPGTKQEFYALLKAYHPPFGYMTFGNFADEYLKRICRFQRGAKPKQRKGTAIWALFPEYPLK